MLTVDFDQFPVGPGDRVLDMGCGGGRHAFALYRRGAHVTALDMDAAELKDVAAMFEAMALEGEAPEGATASAVRGTAYGLPFEDGTFDYVVCSEVLEHLHEDSRAMRELTRVLKPGGLMAVTVPRWLPELLCWALSSAYHEAEGGHVRIYRGTELTRRLEAVGLLGYGLLALLTRALHARDDVRTPTLAAVAGWAAVAAADLLLVASLPDVERVVLLGAGNTVGVTVAGLLLVLGLRRTAGRDALSGCGRTVAAGAVAAGIALLAGSLVPEAPAAVAAVVTTGVAAAAFLLAVRVLDPRGLRELLRA